MMRFLKYSFFLVVLAVAGLLVAPFVIDVNDYRVEISKQVESATGRKFTIGEIHASLFPWIGVELNDVRMANARGFSRPEFLRAKQLQIQVEVMPLLNREVVIRSFRLIDPQIMLEKNGRGESNWQDLTGSSSATASATASDAVPTGDGEEEGGTQQLPALAAKSIVLENGHIGWRDGKGQGVDVDGINLTITDLQQLRPVKLTLAARIGGSQFKLDGKVGPLGALDKLDLTHLPVQLQLVSDHAALLALRPLTGALPEALGGNPVLAIDMQLEQRPDGARITAGTLALTTDAPAVFRQVKASWKGELNQDNDLQLRSAELTVDQQRVMKLNGTVTKLASQPKFHLRIQSDALSRQWLMHYAPALESLYVAHPAAWKTIQVGTLLRGDSKRVVFDDLQLVLNGEPLQGQGSLRVGKSPKVNLTLSGHVLHLDPWLPKPKVEAKSASTANVPSPEGAVIAVPSQSADAGSAEPDLRPFSPWQADIRLAVDRLTVHGLDLTHFQVAIAGKKGKYRLSPLRFGLSGGQVKEVATININHYPLTWTESLTLSGVQVGPVLRGLADVDSLDGSLAMKTSLHGSGMVADRASQRLGGKGNIVLTNGSVKGFDIAGALRNLTSFQKQTGPKKTDFSTLSASFTITNGVVDNRDLFMASPLFRLTGYGKVNLVSKQLDYHAKPKLVGTLTGQGDTLPVRKGLAVPISITGSFNQPKIRPEIDPMTLINSVGNLLKGGGAGVGKLLKGVTGGVGAGLGGAIGAMLGGQPARSPQQPRGALIAPSTPPTNNGPAMIAPPPNRGGGALIAPRPQQPQSTAPPTQQQQLQNTIGGLLNRL
ncbi:MAG: AsmA family protein [Mariprofundales bacterium]